MKIVIENPPPPWEWGKTLLDAREADPPYDMLVNAYRAGVLTDESLRRWLMGFWLFYHVGVAAFLAERPSNFFWASALMIACKQPNEFVPDGKWPRGGYRRYFRGKAATDTLNYFAGGYRSPEQIVDSLYSGCKTFQGIEKRVKALPTYGYTMSFKIADMGERVLGLPITFDNEMKFPDEPDKGEQITSELFGVDRATVRAKLLYAIKDCPIPGLDTRHPGVQEAETVACEYKHFLSGKFKIGQDGPKLRSHLSGYGDLAQELAKYLP